MTNGLVNGYPDGTLKPKGNTTRAEAATSSKELFNSQNNSQNKSKISERLLSSKFNLLGSSLFVFFVSFCI
ncbi:S-layer homology domain-containing protein [Paenibacillus sp. ALJ109b]|nr:S-layer homology domain-containing protein [Paenibacillus sp. ALJ109b]